MTHGIVEILIENAGVQNLVGRNKDNNTYKVFPVIVPEEEKLPYIVVRARGADPVLCKGSASTVDRMDYQIDCYAKTYVDTWSIHKAIRAALDDKQSTVNDGTVFRRIWFVTYRDFSAGEMRELGRKDIYGIVDFYSADVEL